MDSLPTDDANTTSGGLYAHAYNVAADERSCCALSDVNGALALALATLGGMIEYAISPDHRAIAQLKAAFVGIADAALHTQHPNDGLWPWVLGTDTDVSSLEGGRGSESSGSALLVAALASGVKLGWLGERHAHAARRGFDALTTRVEMSTGIVSAAVPADASYLLLGTPRNSAAEYWAARPLGESASDVAVGAMLLAAAAVAEME